MPWWQACEGGDGEWLEEQLPVLEQYLKNNPQDARAHYLVARAQETLGDFFAAKVHYQAARDADHLPFRATTRINHTLKELAETMGGVEWVDLETYALRGRGGQKRWEMPGFTNMSIFVLKGIIAWRPTFTPMFSKP